VLSPAPEKQRRAMAELCSNPVNPVDPVKKQQSLRDLCVLRAFAVNNLLLVQHAG
jgi:hypothetical protein